MQANQTNINLKTLDALTELLTTACIQIFGKPPGEIYRIRGSEGDGRTGKSRVARSGECCIRAKN
jgi:hypothetical protein